MEAQNTTSITANGLLLEAANAESLGKIWTYDNLVVSPDQDQGEVEIKSSIQSTGNRISVSSNLGCYTPNSSEQHLGDISGIEAGTKETEWKAKFNITVSVRKLSDNYPEDWEAPGRQDKLGRPIQHQVSTGKTLNRSRQYEWDLDRPTETIQGPVQGTVQFGHWRVWKSHIRTIQ